MLTDIALRQANPLMGLIAMLNGNEAAREPVRKAKGIYEIGHFNGNLCIPKDVLLNEHPSLEAPTYGVCDDLANFMEVVGAHLEASERKFVVFMTPILKAAQPNEGGWRWHKWGPYIGKHEPQAEYIYDEPFIEGVFCFSTYEVR